MPIPKRRVAVIGAGPAGAIAADALAKEQAFDTIRVFERRDVAGGTWVLTDDLKPGIPSLQDLLEQRADSPVKVPTSFPCETPSSEELNSHQLRYSDSAAHKNLHSNLPPSVMCFSQEPIPKILSERTLERYGPDAPFRHRQVMLEWVQGVVKNTADDVLVEFGTTVELIQQTDAEWVLTLRKPVPGKSKDHWWQEKFDAVVVATGHYNLPYIPNIPGLVEYDNKHPGRIVHSKHYRDAEQFRNKRVVVVGGSVSAFDALHDIRPVSKGRVISALRRPSAIFSNIAFIHPDIDNRLEISEFEPETGRINFADGSVADDVDVVFFATGFEFSFPFLPDVKPVNRRIPGLYEHVFKIDSPGLVFIGMVTGCFGIRVFEWQAVAAARVLAGHATLPSREEMEKWEQDRLETAGDGCGFWTLMPDFEHHFEALRTIAGSPVPGTSGRVLPKYEPEWGDIFWQFVDQRIKWWVNEARAAVRAQS